MRLLMGHGEHSAAVGDSYSMEYFVAYRHDHLDADKLQLTTF